jgi:hypothetical protein
LKPDTFNIIGKYGCCLTELTIRLTEEWDNHFPQEKLKTNVHFLFEDIYETKLSYLQKKSTDPKLIHHSVTAGSSSARRLPFDFLWKPVHRRFQGPPIEAD